MRRVDALLFLGTLAGTLPSAIAAESTRPRGVGPEFAKYFTSTDSFSCISSPSIKLTHSQINDDFCDCPDGSDEPGTSACSHLSPLSPPQLVPGTSTGTSNTTLTLPGYYCKNKGHQPGYIPFTYVNDGVCDYELCCDGSDEWAGVGGKKCEDKCAQIGKEWKKLNDQREKDLAAAQKKRAELVAQAARLREETQHKVTKLEKEIKDLQEKEQVLKKEYEDIEKREKGRVVKTGGKGSRTTVLAGLAKNRIEELRESLVGVKDERDAAKQKVAQLEGILAAFKEEYNPNFNDEGVKRAVKAWEDYAAGKDPSSEENSNPDLEEIMKPDSETGTINWEEWEREDEESDVEALFKFEEYLPASIREWVHTKLIDARQWCYETGILAEPNHETANESPSVTKARTAYQSVSDDLNNKETEIGKEQADLEKDFGPDDVFRALKDTCINKDSGEYNYELCWLGKTTQKSKKGSSNTGLGNFVRIETMEVDETVGADGKGLGTGERIVLKYENGQHCWNGPNRATNVVLACAKDNEIWKVAELEKCIYRMEVGTPAVCGVDASKAKEKMAAKDEL